MKVHVNNNQDWKCPYCEAIAWFGENKLRHLAKHEQAIAKMLRKNFILSLNDYRLWRFIMENDRLLTDKEIQGANGLRVISPSGVEE